MQGTHKQTHTYLTWALIAILAALSLLFLASRDSVAARLGANLTYSITVANAGPSRACNVMLTDAIPANTTYQTPAAPFTVLAIGGVFTGANSVKVECSLNGNTLTCTPKGNIGLTPSLPDGVLPAGVTDAFSYYVKINASVQGGTIVADEVTITSAPAGGAPGTPNPTITNNGPSNVNNVQVADTLPSNVTYISAVPAIGSGFTWLLANGGVVTCNAPQLPAGVSRAIDITAAMTQVVDTLPTGQTLAAEPDTSAAPGFTCVPSAVGSAGPITRSADAPAPNAQVVIRITAKVDPSLPAGIYNNTATATAMSFDPTPASVTDPAPVITRADLAVNKIAPATAVAGTQMTYKITAINNGPSSANNMMITDQLPTGTVFISATAPGSPLLSTPVVGANGTVKATWNGLTFPGVTSRLFHRRRGGLRHRIAEGIQLLDRRLVCEVHLGPRGQPRG